ncbi:unnamed protein product [Bemisia tabaci]|uniref:Uncharacterized protein n=1 Tax=Bemisia tabaci TaxID=7038 RepID=A0A9P0CGS5_BEMTA|nr:unnamed protein product [Bemisia tabaci]
MAALPRHVLPSYFACVLLVTNIALASTWSPVETADIKHSELSPQVSGADDGVHSLQPRGLFDSLGLTSLFGSVFSGFSNLDKNPGGGSSGLTNLKIQAVVLGFLSASRCKSVRRRVSSCACLKVDITCRSDLGITRSTRVKIWFARIGRSSFPSPSTRSRSVVGDGTPTSRSESR